MIALSWLRGFSLVCFLWIAVFTYCSMPLAFAQDIDDDDISDSSVVDKLSAKHKLVPVKSPPQVLIVNSTSNRIFYQGENRVSTLVQLPKHTIRWYYSIVITPRDEQHQKYQSLLSALMPLLSKDPYALATGAALKWLTPLPRKEALNFYLIDSKAERDKFERGESFKVWERNYNIQSLTASEAHIPSGNSFYMGFENENFLQGLSVQLEVVALTGWTATDKVQLKGFISQYLNEQAFVNGRKVLRRKAAYASFFTDDDIFDSIVSTYTPEEWFEKSDVFKQLAIVEFGSAEGS